MTAAVPGLPATEPTEVGDGVRLAVPAGWAVQRGRPTVVRPTAWPGDEPPAVLVVHEADALSGARLAAAVATGVDRLTDPLVLHLGVTPDDGVDVVVAHRNRGVDVTTVERHHVRPGAGRWVVAFTAADPDVPDLLPLMHGVVASLEDAG